MNISHNKSLKDLNQYGVDVEAKYYIELNSLEDLEELQNSKLLDEKNILILGEGNNILFRNNYNGLIIKPKFKSI
jgi:UDP-N-acetylmuramate dehydrogenase